jgi:drug/metabolite transporter (DMT)-like permease
MKIKFKDENLFLQNIKFSLWSIFFNLLLTISYGHIFHWYIEPIHILGIVFMANYGILTSIVLKNLGSIVKVYSTSLSVFVSILFSYFLWGYQISTYFMLGSILSVSGIYIYIFDKQSAQNIENNPYVLLELGPELVWD